MFKEASQEKVERGRPGGLLAPFGTLEGGPEGGLQEEKKRVVLYTTTLPSVRRTFDTCQSVGKLLRAHNVPVTTKDLHLHPKYANELNQR